MAVFGLKRGDHLAEARAVGPDAVAEHDAGFSAFDFALLFGCCAECIGRGRSACLYKS